MYDAQERLTQLSSNSCQKNAKYVFRVQRSKKMQFIRVVLRNKLRSQTRRIGLRAEVVAATGGRFLVNELR